MSNLLWTKSSTLKKRYFRIQQEILYKNMRSRGKFIFAVGLCNPKKLSIGYESNNRSITWHKSKQKTQRYSKSTLVRTCCTNYKHKVLIPARNNRTTTWRGWVWSAQLAWLGTGVRAWRDQISARTNSPPMKTVRENTVIFEASGWESNGLWALRGESKRVHSIFKWPVSWER